MNENEKLKSQSQIEELEEIILGNHRLIAKLEFKLDMWTGEEYETKTF